MAREPKHIARSQGKASAPADPASEPPEGARGTSPDLDRLHAARETVAKLFLGNLAYGKLFKRLEQEIAIEEAARSQNVIERARALLR